MSTLQIRLLLIVLTIGVLFGAVACQRGRSDVAPIAGVLLQPAEPCSGDHQRADVRVTQSLNPNLTVPAGGIVTTVVVVRNLGSCPADNAEITLPLAADAVTALDAVTSRPQSWVRDVSPDRLVIATGPLDGGTVVSATIRLQTRPTLPDGFLLQQRLTFTADHNRYGPSGSSNLVQLRVGQLAASADTVPLGVDPYQAPAGTDFEFGSSLFAPLEPVSFWLNDPFNHDIPVTTTVALADGSLTLAFDSSPLSPGVYRMVAFGNLSAVRAVAEFNVLPALPPPPQPPDRPTATATAELTTQTPTLTSSAVITVVESLTPTATDTATATATATDTATATATATNTATAEP